MTEDQSLSFRLGTHKKAHQIAVQPLETDGYGRRQTRIQWTVSVDLTPEKWSPLSLLKMLTRSNGAAEKHVSAQYSLEFKLEAIHKVRKGESISLVAKVLGIPKTSLGKCVRLAAKGEIAGASDKARAPTPEQAEMARLREYDIAKNCGVPCSGHDARHLCIEKI